MQSPTPKISEIALIAALLLGLPACGGGGGGGGGSASVVTSSSSSSSATTYSYQGAGSDWSLKLNGDGTCVVSEKSSNLTVNATCAKLASGFTQVTVTSATGGSVAIPQPSVGDKTYAVEIAGYMMPFIGFAESGKRKVVPTVVAGNCTTNLAHNFVVSFAQANSVTSDFSGWGAYGKYATSDGKNLTVSIYKSDGTILANNQTQAIDLVTGCSAGKVTVVDAATKESSRFYLTQNGGAILYQDRTQSTDPSTAGSVENDFMLPVDNTITTLSKLDGSYRGFVITGNGQTSYTNTSVSVAAASGIFTVSALNADTSAVANATHSAFTLMSAVTPGLYAANLTHGAVGAVGCAATLNGGGKKVVICGGIDPADATKKTLYSIMLVAQ